METISIVQVISKEIIKPSSQTPNHLRNLKLSALDRLQPPVYIPLIFFYQSDDDFNGLTNRAQISQKLKQSLSDTLTAFYPLAGKLDRENFMVDCDDSGVTYVEARVHARLSEAIQDDPTTKLLKMYLPVDSTSKISENILLAVQINFFDCGGIAIGSCMSHLIGDGLSASVFMNSWAATCRGEGEIPKPNFDLADHFPDTDDAKKYSLANLVVPEEIFVTKRFVFDKEKLAALRASSESSNGAIKDPTRVELVSSFIWKYFIQATISKKLKITIASQAVNLRKRMIPPPSLEHVFGNCYVNHATMFDQGDKGNIVPEIHDLVPEFRNLVRSVNDEQIRKWQGQGEDGYVSQFNSNFDVLSKGGFEYCGFSGWCRFPAYEVDYGWGKPVWVCTTGFPLLNAIILMDDRSGDGIEAWINSVPDDLNAIESHVKLLSNAIAGDNSEAIKT